MYSIAFPNMFTSSRTLLYKDNEATTSNLSLMLKSDKNSLFGDPYYGTNLRNTFFSQNNVILQDLVIDEIYTAIQEFMPQIVLSRNSIRLFSRDTNLYATIEGMNLIDYTTNLYTIQLVIGGEGESR